MHNKKTTALILFSGGLDSMIAAKVLQAQGIEVAGVCCVSNFFDCGKAKKAAEEISIDLKIIDISEELLEIVKNPPSGYGKHLNPCVDCHSLMVKKAGKYLSPSSLYSDTPLLIRRGAGGEVLATGEVLGQRSFSQNKEALSRIEKMAGVEILRPLSAKLLPETTYEKQGLVNRGRLLNIKGRSRERQMELAEKHKLKNYSSPAGGCILTDPEFSNRLMKMLDYWPDCGVNDVELLKHGRVFWLTLNTPIRQLADAKKRQKVLIIVGRHKEDNENLEKLARKGDILLELKDMTGPLSLVRNSKFQIPNNKQIPQPEADPPLAENSKFQIPNILEINVPEKLKMSELKFGEEKSEEEILRIAGLLTGHYAVKARGKKVKLKVKSL
ncbi:tRNA 4-thiouridine(8) synthase ThiI [Patescibacteria group bacterium]|nr:tRNA 4-thiouridine(8) synthase ThiI [Candidatus Falkowbacteria bacterium]MBU3905609.1 tRNA 4-thiouridine(8) synthase ThiI [Patescibacteria group bacterium]MBU4014608.1 tRNA 4-thiouridine(8) synthase ThiI [Patescibacteria group bacterium]MBU4026336.1 tRNA 4-thiouridine(8) synthase ThiI [Patescibacteria group bacterium]MBU4072820.1 tRNA 4-thiouridine(8) synthase ThiI [Patescibacteria group bacterium]